MPEEYPSQYGTSPEQSPEQSPEPQPARSGPEERDRILTTVKKHLARVGPLCVKYRRQGSINERFCLGDQWSATVWAKGSNSATLQDNAWFDDEGVPRVYTNHLQNLTLTWSSLLTKNRPSVTAYPASDTPDDLFRAEVANKLIDFFVAEEDTAAKIHQAVTYSCQHGTAGLKIVFDKEAGAIKWAPLTIMNYFIDLTPDWKDARWVIFEDHITVDDAQAIFDRYGIHREPNEVKYKTAANEDMLGVSKLEFWQRPCRDYPRGLYACLVDDEVTEVIDEYPYVVETDGKPEYLLPLVLMKVRNVRDSAYGYTNLTDCVPLQRALNEINSRLIKIMRQTSNVHLLLPKELGGEDFKVEENTVIFFNSAQSEAAREIRYTTPPQISPVLFNYRDYWRTALNEVMGINEITAGDKTRSLSGRAIENIVELDTQKNADAAKSLETMTEAAWRLTLALVQITYTEPRTIKITGDTGVDVLQFRGADIAGVDVRLEPASEIDKLAEAKGARADERAQAGLPPARDAASSRLMSGISRQAAEQIVADYLAGRNVQLEPEDLDLETVAEVVTRHRARALSQGRQADWIALGQLLDQLRELAQRASQARPVAPAEEPTPETPTAPGEGAGEPPA